MAKYIHQQLEFYQRYIFAVWTCPLANILKINWNNWGLVGAILEDTKWRNGQMVLGHLQHTCVKLPQYHMATVGRDAHVCLMEEEFAQA